MDVNLSYFFVFHFFVMFYFQCNHNCSVKMIWQLYIHFLQDPLPKTSYEYATLPDNSILVLLDL